MGYGESVAVDEEAAQIAVTEVRREHESVIWGDGRQHSSEGTPELLLIFTSGSMLILPSASIFPMLTASLTAYPIRKVSGRLCRKAM